MSDDLKNFTISAKVPRTIDKKGPKKSSVIEAPSAGFPIIESILEQETVDLGDFGNRHAELVELSDAKGADNRVKANARKAAIAYERTHDLLEYLLSTKAQMKASAK